LWSFAVWYRCACAVIIIVVGIFESLTKSIAQNRESVLALAQQICSQGVLSTAKGEFLQLMGFLQNEQPVPSVRENTIQHVAMISAESCKDSQFADQSSTQFILTGFADKELYFISLRGGLIKTVRSTPGVADSSALVPNPDARIRTVSMQK
jgi:hypothetical protein